MEGASPAHPGIKIHYVGANLDSIFPGVLRDCGVGDCGGVWCVVGVGLHVRGML